MTHNQKILAKAMEIAKAAGIKGQYNAEVVSQYKVTLSNGAGHYCTINTKTGIISDT